MTPLLAQRPRTDRAFERVYRRHVGDVYRYTLAVLRNPVDAEDVTQTTFLNAYRAFQKGERPENPHNWLIAIAHNVCRQRFRQSARRPQEVAWDTDLADKIDDDDVPTVEDIRRALGHLAFNQRAALVMRELEGRSYQEISEILGVSVSAVETLIFRARRALREQLEGTLSCGEAELAISKQLDRRLSRGEKAQLRAHLRECRDCATFARRQRAQRAALKSIGAVPLPTSLASFFGGGSGTIVGGIAAKTAVVATAGALVAGGGYKAATQLQAAPPRGSAEAAATTGGPLASGGVVASGGLLAPGGLLASGGAPTFAGRVSPARIGSGRSARPAKPERVAQRQAAKRVERAAKKALKARRASRARGARATPLGRVRSAEARSRVRPVRAVHKPKKAKRRTQAVPPPRHGRSLRETPRGPVKKTPARMREVAPTPSPAAPDKPKAPKK